MLHGPAPRSAHRAAPEGGLALLVQQGWGQDSGTTGHHRPPPPQRRAPREPQRTLQALMSGLGVLIVLGICGLSGFFIVADERRGHGGETPTRAPEDNQRIRARSSDPRPMTLAEVFPAGEIHPVRELPGTSPYQVGMVHIDSDCHTATTGRLGAVLDAYGCSQVVRAEVTAPYGGYQVTAGIFNLADAAGADRAGEQARQLVETGGGTFAAMVASGPSTDPRVQPLAQVGWHGRGHYLVYCVIAHPDGQIVRDDDPYADRITSDLVESYLGDQVIGHRALRP